ncbi:MAG: MarR family transcriptional regulator [Eubacteriaceae bacterium]|nr:MarR family transcriptional regulator [Eubacteriaceae bacterium]
MQDIDLLEKIARITGEYRRLFHRVLEESGYKGIKGGGRILHHLLRSDGIAQKELAVRMDVRPQSLTGVLEKLENAGLIERKRSSADKREQQVFITEKGRSDCEKLIHIRQQAAEKLLEALDGTDKEKLGDILERIIH